MIPSPAERDELFKRFARALFKVDMDALYQVVTPDFLWSFHDGLAATKSLQGPHAIAAHLAEQLGIERYSFGDRKLATKDVYRKPL
jgi:hypothetical protein